ncbi:MAG: type II toxin-antitoxin system HicA family toxin [Bacteroidales bacterium]|nr:type II toxin-antitoxin system HicA family toxin [Bacteroidales bacterium]
MKRYKVIEVIRMLEADGWIMVRQRGDHRQFKNPNKRGLVTISNKKSATLEQEILNNIWKQAGWK